MKNKKLVFIYFYQQTCIYFAQTRLSTVLQREEYDPLP